MVTPSAIKHALGGVEELALSEHYESKGARGSYHLSKSGVYTHDGSKRCLSDPNMT